MNESQNNIVENEVYYQVSNNYIARNIVGEVILIPINEQNQKLNGMITLNGSGAYLWEILETKKTEAELVSSLARKYNISECDVEDDVKLFIERAIKQGFIERL